jgi:CSLREA domain-containing protein
LVAKHIRLSFRQALALGSTAALAALGAGATAVVPAAAATYTVNTTDDSWADANCAPAPGHCSLREAINAANQTTGALVSVPAGHYNLDPKKGPLQIKTSMTVEGAGNGPTGTVVDGGGKTRVFVVLPGGEKVTIKDLRVEHGNSFAGGGVANGANLWLVNDVVENSIANFAGGGVLNFLGNVTVKGGDVFDNWALAGGGLMNYSEGTLEVDGATVAGNHAVLGGGVFDVGPVSLNGATLDSNTAEAAGGGLMLGQIEQEVWVPTAGVVRNTTFNHNVASGNEDGRADGGAIFVQPYTTLDLGWSALVANIANGSGGGVANFGTAKLLNDTLNGNQAEFHGGGVLQGFFRLLPPSAPTTNGANTQADVYNSLALKTLVLPDNLLQNGPTTKAPINPLREVEKNEKPTTTIDFVTIASNAAGAGPKAGGGVFNSRDDDDVVLGNTILSANLGGTGQTSNCGGHDLSSAGYNLENGNTCDFSATGDLVNTDPKLGNLMDNGGPTETMALLTGSPAIDAATPKCAPPKTDQRGVSRPQGPRCDIGAYEAVVQVAPSPTPSATPTSLPKPPVTGTGSTLTASRSGLGWAVVLFLAGLAALMVVGSGLLLRRRGA